MRAALTGYTTFDMDTLTHTTKHCIHILSMRMSWRDSEMRRGKKSLHNAPWLPLQIYASLRSLCFLSQLMPSTKVKGLKTRLDISHFIFFVPHDWLFSQHFLHSIWLASNKKWSLNYNLIQFGLVCSFFIRLKGAKSLGGPLLIRVFGLELEIKTIEEEQEEERSTLKSHLVLFKRIAP